MNGRQSAALEDRRRPSAALMIAAASVVVISLAALVTLPILLNQRMEGIRDELEQHADPARAALNEISFRMSEQIASLTRAAASGAPQSTERYRRAIEPQRAAMRILQAHRGRLGSEYQMRLEELGNRLELWHLSVQRSVDSQRLAFESNYPDVIEAIRRLDESITRVQAGRRQQVERLTQIQVWLTVGLVLMAMGAALVVIWIIARLRQLASMLEEESDARQGALEREQDLVRMRDEILGVVSHDLRSPLTTIALSAELLPDASPEERAEHVETILTTTGRMERLIRDLLDVTKIDHGALQIRRDLVKPAEVVKEVVAGHEPIADSKEIQLETSIDETLPEIMGDPDRLAQALGNLIGNAFKFTPSGGMVRVSLVRRDRIIRFEVCDNGPGIAPADLPHLFDPFWQAKKTAHLGAGLGLKIARAIVEAHGGSIEVDNLVGGGALFAFELPAAPTGAPDDGLDDSRPVETIATQG
ncbi:MAG: hypothetical protein KY459_05560 [Acidobacteria bacterium]|nr:hypothetical protein [Acidobacteriota bacterium]